MTKKTDETEKLTKCKAKADGVIANGAGGFFEKDEAFEVSSDVAAALKKRGLI